MARNRYDWLSEISTSLAHLLTQVQAESSAGMTSRNKVAENILLPVFRQIFGLPNLVNTNAGRANFPGIDLWDAGSGFAIQVTSEKTADKVTKTINAAVATGLPVTRLVIAQIANVVPRYQKKNRQLWANIALRTFAFNSATDILAFDGLYNLIQALPHEVIAEIATELGLAVQGIQAWNLVEILNAQAQVQLQEEQRIGRYIPDVFVEDRHTKYEARCFSHPTLFVRHISEWYFREPFANINELSRSAGLPEISEFVPTASATVRTVKAARAAALSISEGTKKLDRALVAYTELESAKKHKLRPSSGTKHIFEATRYTIGRLASGLSYRLNEKALELECVIAPLFLLTGQAGQGKTNFLCDFVERFLLKYDIPCAYLTARQIGRTYLPDVATAVCEIVFPPRVGTLEKAIDILRNECVHRGCPFVIVIDGLNEHPDVQRFAGQLEHFLRRMLRHPHVRVMMTCRSEFLDARFGPLINGSLKDSLHRSTSHLYHDGDDQFRELVERYFAFFNLNSDLIAPRVFDVLQKDRLLLRFFCEAYGGRDKGPQYEQPRINGMYRDEIFRSYVQRKLDLGNDAISGNVNSTRPLSTPTNLKGVIRLVVKYMLDNTRFADVPRTVIPSSMDADLTALLDEELILRKDIGKANSILDQEEEVLNFTFDELRDYLLAQYLLSIHSRSASEFLLLLDSFQPTFVQSLEGVQRFLFYASRIPSNAAFLADYEKHAWYSNVYNREIFNIQPTHLSAADGVRITAVMTQGGHVAQSVARRLARNWHTVRYPILNIELLLEFANRNKETAFEDVIAPTFGASSYGSSSSADQLCDFLIADVLPKLDDGTERKFRPLFRFLLLLLPLDGTHTLDSQPMSAFSELCQVRPNYAVAMLEEAVDEANSYNMAYLWRLLGDVAPQLLAPSRLTQFRARQLLSETSTDSVVRREIERFLHRLPEITVSRDDTVS